tara:strand:- start:275 stop:421 length:147 start_codon:yes stop_codon:yes gene_type:complete
MDLFRLCHYDGREILDDVVDRQHQYLSDDGSNAFNAGITYNELAFATV